MKDNYPRWLDDEYSLWMEDKYLLKMEQRSSLRMFMLPFISFCASACFQISGLIKNLNDNNHEEDNSDLVKIFCFIGVSLTSIRFGYCIASGCWDNPNYEGNPTYWMVEYLSITLNALTNVVNSNMFQIVAFASSIISMIWNLTHALKYGNTWKIIFHSIENCLTKYVIVILFTIFILGPLVIMIFIFAMLIKTQNVQVYNINSPTLWDNLNDLVNTAKQQITKIVSAF